MKYLFRRDSQVSLTPHWSCNDNFDVTSKNFILFDKEPIEHFKSNISLFPPRKQP